MILEVLHSCLHVIWLSVYMSTGYLAICLVASRAWGRQVTLTWAYPLSPGIPGDPWDPWGSLGFHGIPVIPRISWDPWGFMGSLDPWDRDFMRSLGIHGIPGIPGTHWIPGEPWDFMGSLGSMGFHGIHGIRISWDLWDGQAASQVQGAGGRGRQPLGSAAAVKQPTPACRITPKVFEVLL